MAFDGGFCYSRALVSTDKAGSSGSSMFARRLIVLYALFVLALGLVAARLWQLQVRQGDKWRADARSFVHRHYLTDTHRGTIRDRNGAVAAIDVPAWDLAVDYRALIREDRWLTHLAIRTLKEKMKVQEREQRRKLLPKVKSELDEQLDRAPRELGQLCGVSELEFNARFNEIHRRMQLLRQDRWGRRYDRRNDQTSTESETDPLKEERSLHPILPNLPEKVALDLMDILDDEDLLRSKFPGFVVVRSRRRDYPFGPVAAHVIGSMRPVSAHDFDYRPEEVRGRRELLPLFAMPNLLQENPGGDLWGYLPGDRRGAAGVEAASEKVLRGARGLRMIELGRRTPEREVPPRGGGDVRMTLDLQLQRALTAALLDPQRGLRRDEKGEAEHPVSLVILNIADGQILTMISVPTYDPNAWERRKGEWLSDRKNSPLTNRALGGASPPGSTIKPIIAMAALVERVVTSGTPITCSGRLYPQHPHMFRCLGIHGPTALTRALEKSCNVYFYTLGSNLGLERETEWFQRFGFGERTGIEIGEAEARGGYAQVDVIRRSGPSALTSEAIQEGIGQGKLWASPVQVANAYATILRGGKVLAPRVLLDTPVRTIRDTPLPPEHVEAVRQGLRAVTVSGTARSLKLKLPVGGKTGSATAFRPAFDDAGQPLWEEPPKPLLDRIGRPLLDAEGRPRMSRGRQKSVEGTDAWFVGYAPADTPQFVICAMMEFGGHGGSAATPMFKEAVLELQRHGYLPAMDVEPPER